MGLLGNSNGGSPGLPSVIPSPTFTGVSSFAPGTAAAPSVASSSDAQTGGYWPTTSEFGVSTGTTAITKWNASGQIVHAGGYLAWGSSVLTSPDNYIFRIGANQLRFGATTGTATSRAEISKAVTAFADAVAKSVFTVTVPNAAHHAVIELEIQGALGAGGAVGAGEAMATNTYKIAIVRTAGVATVATATAASDGVAVAVAGANTVTATAAVSAMTGAVGATQTFEINVTITKNAGASDNHTCLAYAKLMNANATGITIA